MSLGDRFARAARAPLVASTRAFDSMRMGEGIRQLERVKLAEALQLGVADVAATVGVPPTEVSGRLPWAEIESSLERIEKRQAKALRSIHRQEMTVATFAMPDELPKAPSASEHLSALAALFARDKDIATGLRDLAFEVGAWEALIDRSTTLLDGDEGFQQRIRRRQQLRGMAMVGAGAAVILGCTVVPVVLWRRHEAAEQAAAAQAREQAARQAASDRADAVLASPDACAPDGIDDAARALLTDTQRQGLAARGQHCEAQREVAARALRCADLAAHLASGSLTDADRATAGPAAAVLTRAATNALTPADLQADLAALPCPDEATRAAALKLLTRSAAAASGLTLWGLAENISPDLARSLAAPGVLTIKTAQTIAFRAESVATGALLSHRPEDAARARSLCSLKRDLGQALAMSCDKILR